jgi:Zn-dependent protease with chaperone function
MNFFENQDRARRNSQQLTWLFILSIIVIILAIYAATILILGVRFGFSWHPGLFVIIATITTIIISLASLYKISVLRKGGWVIAEELGGQLLLSEMANEQERQLLNIVEEMAIAAGIPVPEVYLLGREPSINAFAAGFTPNDAAIGVTRGCLEHLNRDELQGVIGHEFSHILNGDMQLNIRLMGLLHGILFIYLTGEFFLDIRSSRSKGFYQVVFGLALMSIGSIGLLCGRMIKAAVSRQREFLADASAVQFTRNADGIAGALQKLQKMDSRLLSSRAEAASHMFFGNVLNIYFWENLFATHPPLGERVRRIRGLKPSKLANQAGVQGGVHNPDSLAMGFANGGSATPEKVVSQVGTVTPQHYGQAQALLAKLPESLRLGVRETQTAMTIAFALMLDTTEADVTKRQIDWLRQVQPEDIVENTLLQSSEITNLDTSIRLPLVDLMVPALRKLSPIDCQRLCKCTQGLVKAGGRSSIWQFVLQLVLWHRLQPVINPDLVTEVQFTNIEQIWSDCILLLSAIAKVGQSESGAIDYAFRSGVFRLPGVGQLQPPQAPVNFNLVDINKSIEHLRLASPKLKQAIVDACAHTVLMDNKVTPNEADLLRAIAMTLDCPIPPFLNKRTN